MNESRQVFATKLGLSLTAVQNYETDREPDYRALVRLLDRATSVDPRRPDLEKAFRQAIRDASENAFLPDSLEGSLPYRSEDEWRRMRAVQWVMRDERFQDLQDDLDRLLKPVYKHLDELGLQRKKKGEELLNRLDEYNKRVKKKE